MQDLLFSGSHLRGTKFSVVYRLAFSLVSLHVEDTAASLQTSFLPLVLCYLFSQRNPLFSNSVFLWKSYIIFIQSILEFYF